MSIVALAGSPSANSRSTALLRHVLSRFDDRVARSEIVLRDLPPAALVRADFDDPAIRRAREQVAAARLVVIATPIYKASFSGLLKTFLDLLPQDALRGKTVLALGTGGSPAHLLALDYALKPVLAALGARHILDAVYAVDAQFTPHRRARPRGARRRRAARRARAGRRRRSRCAPTRPTRRRIALAA